jgi:uncharacterized protein (DUF58 family)
MKPINFARWNHVLIPATKDGRDRIRAGWIGKVATPLLATYGALTDDGRTVALLALVVASLGLDVMHSEQHVLAAMLLALLLASLVARPFYAITTTVKAEVDVPRRVGLGEELELGVTLENRGGEDVLAVRVTGPFLPWDGRWVNGTSGVSRLPPGARVRVALRAKFTARGEHHLDACDAAALVPFGLARGPGAQTAGARFLVLPRPARVVRLTLPETRRADPGGVALASQTGESMELLGVRPYRSGDPVRHLHARSWARTGQPIVREYQEEYFRRAAVVVDVDARDEASAEGAISLAAGAVAHLARGEARVDLLVAGQRIHDLTLGRSLGSLEQALDLLACFRPQRPSDEMSRRLIAQLEPHLARLSCVVVIDAGTGASVIVDRVRTSGVGCAWLRVARGAPEAEAGGAQIVDVAAINRGQELVL